MGEKAKDLMKKYDLDEVTTESTHNLVGFFSLLLKIDKRNNPEKYGRGN